MGGLRVYHDRRNPLAERVGRRMLRCVDFHESLRDEWDRFAWANGTVFHTLSIRGILLDSFGYECHYKAIVDENNRIHAIIPLVAGRNLSLSKVGVSLPFLNYLDICADSQESFQFAVGSLEELCRKHSWGYVELRLKNQTVDRPNWRVNVNNHTFVLPLDGGEEAVLALSTSSNRNHVRKVYKQDWFDVSFDSVHLKAFYRVYVQRMKQLGSPAPDIRFFERFLFDLPDHASLMTVLDKRTRKVVGGMLLLASPGNGTLYYPYGATLVEYNQKYVNNYMYWEAVKHGMSRGLRFLDLGRSQTGSGTYKYKLQWGARPEQLSYYTFGDGSGAAGGPDKQSLSLAVSLWKVAPTFITNIVGKKLIKYVMP